MQCECKMHIFWIIYTTAIAHRTSHCFGYKLFQIREELWLACIANVETCIKGKCMHAKRVQMCMSACKISTKVQATWVQMCNVHAMWLQKYMQRECKSTVKLSAKVHAMWIQMCIESAGNHQNKVNWVHNGPAYLLEWGPSWKSQKKQLHCLNCMQDLTLHATAGSVVILVIKTRAMPWWSLLFDSHLLSTIYPKLSHPQSSFMPSKSLQNSSQVLTGFVMFCKVLEGFDRFCQLLAGFAMFCQLLAGFAMFWKVLPGFPRFC